MRVFYVDQSVLGVYPVGFCSIIVAEDAQVARCMFEQVAVAEGLELTDRFGIPIPYDIKEIDTTKPSVDIIINGDY